MPITLCRSLVALWLRSMYQDRGTTCSTLTGRGASGCASFEVTVTLVVVEVRFHSQVKVADAVISTLSLLLLPSEGAGGAEEVSAVKKNAKNWALLCSIVTVCWPCIFVLLLSCPGVASGAPFSSPSSIAAAGAIICAASKQGGARYVKGCEASCTRNWIERN